MLSDCKISLPQAIYAGPVNSLINEVDELVPVTPAGWAWLSLSCQLYGLLSHDPCAAKCQVSSSSDLGDLEHCSLQLSQ